MSSQIRGLITASLSHYESSKETDWLHIYLCHNKLLHSSAAKRSLHTVRDWLTDWNCSTHAEGSRKWKIIPMNEPSCHTNLLRHTVWSSTAFLQQACVTYYSWQVTAKTELWNLVNCDENSTDLYVSTTQQLHSAGRKQSVCQACFCQSSIIFDVCPFSRVLDVNRFSSEWMKGEAYEGIRWCLNLCTVQKKKIFSSSHPWLNTQHATVHSVHRPHALTFPKWKCRPPVVVLLLSPSTALWGLTELTSSSSSLRV